MTQDNNKLRWVKKKFFDNEFVFGSVVVLIFVFLYYMIFARDLISQKYIFPGDTNDFWYMEYITLYSLKNFNAFPWWDPTVWNGYPLYYHFLGWQNYFGPFYLPYFAFFKILSLFADVSINTYRALHITIYVFTLNIIAVYLIARELVSKKIAAILPVLIFSFSFFQIIGIRDSHIVEAMIAPLFYVYALVHFNNKRTIKNFLLLLIFFIIFLASLGKSVQTSAIFWSTIFSGLILVFNLDILKDVFNIILQLLKTPKGKIILTVLIMLVFLSICSSFSSIFYNTGHILKYRGGDVSWKLCNDFSNNPIPVETSEIWTILNNWFPFSAIHDLILDFAWCGHDYRYIGLVTLPLIFTMVTLGLKNRYTFTLLLTYFICNGYIIYTTDNAVYKILTDTSSAFRNSRNMLTGFPSGGPSLFLIFLCGIGLDTLLKKNEGTEVGILNESTVYNNLFKGTIGFLLFLGILLFICFIFSAIMYKFSYMFSRLFNKLPLPQEIITKWHSYKFDNIRVSFLMQSMKQLRLTFFHMSLYLIVYSYLCFILYSTKNKNVITWMLISLFILVFTDMTISASYQLNRSLNIDPVNSPDLKFYCCKKPYDPSETIPDNIKFGPIISEKQRLVPTKYSTPWQNQQKIEYGTREWLVLATNEDGQKFLINWNPITLRMRKYPEFKFYSNAFYIPFERIKDVGIDKSITEKIPLFYLHDASIVDKVKGMPIQTEGVLEIIEYTFNKVVIKTNTSKDGFLCFLDNYDKFWTAYVDGNKVKIHRANFCFKAIELNSGEHTITWVYNPYPIKIAYTSFYFLLSVFLGCCYFFRKDNIRYEL